MGLFNRSSRSLRAAWQGALFIENFQIKQDSYVIFSDLHKGDRQIGSDDFQRNELIYCHALNYYYDRDYRLVLNGDIEECWECDPEQVISSYKKTVFAIEKKFNMKEGYYLRVFGNHDNCWKKERNVNLDLVPAVGKVTCYPAILLGDKIFIVHGHQGEIMSDICAIGGRMFARFFWKRLQHKFFYLNTSAASSNAVRNRRDLRLYSWARENKLLLIAGHTHRAMFASLSKVDQLGHRLLEISHKLQSPSPDVDPVMLHAQANSLRNQINSSPEEYEKDKEYKRLGEHPSPCYFNIGCGIYSNGITAIELDRGKIRLVKWEMPRLSSSSIKHKDSPGVSFRRIVFQEDNIQRILNRLN
jgi:UDP-2,3-diacylglucosamine pyrophosphatase LpxH